MDLQTFQQTSQQNLQQQTSQQTSQQNLQQTSQQDSYQTRILPKDIPGSSFSFIPESSSYSLTSKIQNEQNSFTKILPEGMPGSSPFPFMLSSPSELSKPQYQQNHPEFSKPQFQSQFQPQFQRNLESNQKLEYQINELQRQLLAIQKLLNPSVQELNSSSSLGFSSLNENQNQNQNQNQMMSDDINTITYQLKYIDLNKPFIIDFVKTVLNEKELKDSNGNIIDIKFSDLCMNTNISSEFINAFIDKIDWYILSKNKSIQNDNFKIIKEFKDHFDWKDLCKNIEKVDDFINEFREEIDWESVSLNKNIKEETIEKNIENIKFELLNHKIFNFSSDFVLRHYSKFVLTPQEKIKLFENFNCKNFINNYFLID